MNCFLVSAYLDLVDKGPLNWNLLFCNVCVCMCVCVCV